MQGWFLAAGQAEIIVLGLRSAKADCTLGRIIGEIVASKKKKAISKHLDLAEIRRLAVIPLHTA